MDQEISATFVNVASGILGDTMLGLSGSQIISVTSACAVDGNIPTLPNAAMGMKSKTTVLRENIMAFHGANRYRVLKELCDHPKLKENSAVQELRIKLVTQYGAVFDRNGVGDLDDLLITETSHWLQNYPEAFKSFSDAVTKHNAKVLQRNLLDDLRLSLESLVKQILKNGKSLENQRGDLGKYLEERDGSVELRNMFQSMVAYYCTYQNSHVKHNDDVNAEEIEVIFEITACFLKHLVRLNVQSKTL